MIDDQRLNVSTSKQQNSKRTLLDAVGLRKLSRSAVFLPYTISGFSIFDSVLLDWGNCPVAGHCKEIHIRERGLRYLLHFGQFGCIDNSMLYSAEFPRGGATTTLSKICNHFYIVLLSECIKDSKKEKHTFLTAPRVIWKLTIRRQRTFR